MDVASVDHAEFYVGDAQQTAYFLCTAFGFHLYGRGGPETGLADQRSLLLGHGRIRILLTSGLTADHPATRYVLRHGDGVACLGDVHHGRDQGVRGGRQPRCAAGGRATGCGGAATPRWSPRRCPASVT